jgi:uncharacterized membrane protein HdeD (DUF308 family)
MLVVDGKLLMGFFLLFAGLLIFNFPDILQYALAAVLVVSGAVAIISSMKKGPSSTEGPGAQFRRVDEEDK